jgi:hypothetical protein
MGREEGKGRRGEERVHDVRNEGGGRIQMLPHTSHQWRRPTRGVMTKCR